jgi:hypothetical protein
MARMTSAPHIYCKTTYTLEGRAAAGSANTSPACEPRRGGPDLEWDQFVNMQGKDVEVVATDPTCSPEERRHALKMCEWLGLEPKPAASPKASRWGFGRAKRPGDADLDRE